MYPSNRSWITWVAGISLLIGADTAYATTITVNSPNSPSQAGICVLRDAIIAANTNAAVNACLAGQGGGIVDTIAFAITPLDGTVKTIALAVPLPAITQAVVIDGYTQNGAVANTLASGSNATPKIYLDGLVAGNTAVGLTINAAGSGSTIRGLVIGRFGSDGILMTGSGNNRIIGNFIGLNAAGTVAQGNGTGGLGSGAGVHILADANLATANGNLVGGTLPADRNVIAANSGGVKIEAYNGGAADGNQIQGNLIGSNKSGLAAVFGASGGAGVTVAGATNTTVGSTTGTTPNGACSGGCNMVAGNFYQFNLSNIPSGTTVIQSNHIGINAPGTALLTNPPPFNTQTGIYLSATSGTVRVGGTTATARNVVSGNGSNGMDFQNFGFVATIIIQGNYVGTNSAGTAAVANGNNGISIYNTTDALIGGIVPGAGNVVSGNTYVGIILDGGASTTVQGNLIGTAADGVSDVGNGRDGIRIASQGFVVPNDNLIGAATSGGPGGNRIAYNGQTSAFLTSGVVVSTGVRNRISTNSIGPNFGTPYGLGIDLQGDDVTANDTCDPDVGANDFSNFPRNFQGYTSAGVTHVSGNMMGLPSTQYTLEFYASPSSSPSGFGEGQTYLGSTTVTTSGGPGCFAVFNTTTAITAAPGSFISAIAIAANGNTSEFSASSDRIFGDGFDL